MHAVAYTHLSSFSSMPVAGQGKIGNYALSQDFIDDIMLTKTGEDYDKAALSSAGYTYVPDNTYTQKHFIEPVSYTHLDVYKRQVRFRWGRTHRFPPHPYDPGYRTA